MVTVIRGGDVTVVDLCRVTVRTHLLDTSAAVDLALPARMELGEMMPSVVDLVGGQPNAGPTGFAACWTLSRLGGSVLDESMTLDESGVRDGDHLLLSTEVPAPAPDFNDLSGYVVDASASADRYAGWSQRLGFLAWVWSAGLGAATLVWPNHVAQGNRAVTAAIVAVAAIVATVVASHIDVEPLVTVSLGTTAVVFGALAGYLTVPGGPMPPNLFLAAAICSAVSTVLIHATFRGSTLFIAITTLSMIVAVVAASATLWPIPTATLGAALASVSLAMLSVAAKVSVFVTGLSPRMPTAADALGDDEPVPATVGLLRAQRGHQVLTGLLTGFSLSAALGAVTVIADLPGESAWNRIAFAGVVSIALIIRADQQRGTIRSIAVLLAGLISATATFTSAVIAAPQHAIWFCVIAVAAGSIALYLTRADLGSRLSPFTRRGFEATEYLVLAAVVPMACWASGVFGLVRGLSLT